MHDFFLGGESFKPQRIDDFVQNAKVMATWQRHSKDTKVQDTIIDPSFVQSPSFVHLEFLCQFTLNLYQKLYMMSITSAERSPGISL